MKVKYFDTIQELAGPPLVAATVTVTDHFSGNDADLFEDDGTTPKANPTTTNANGLFSFKTTPGRYDILIEKGPFTLSQEDVTIAQDQTVVNLINDEGSALVFGELVYISGDGLVKKAQSDGTDDEASAVALCLETTLADGVSGKFRLLGQITLTGVAGEVGYLSQLGEITATEPTTGAGDLFLTVVGRWVEDNLFMFKPHAPLGIL